MNFRILAQLLGATAVTLACGALPADAATKKRAVVYATSRSPNVSYMAGPRTRIFVTKRSWLDAGVEVQPGDRHYLDYALPPTHVTGQTFIGPSAPAGWQNPWYPALGPFEAPYRDRIGW